MVGSMRSPSQMIQIGDQVNTLLGRGEVVGKRLPVEREQWLVKITDPLLGASSAWLNQTASFHPHELELVDKGKSESCQYALRLMDRDFDYSDAVKITCREFPSISREHLEAELDQYI